MEKIKRISPGRFIVLGFVVAILFGTIMLALPFTSNEGVNVSPIDALFTSTSAVCVTGLVTMDTADTFNVFGRTIIAILIQIGGLGVASVGVGFILLVGKSVTFKERLVLKEGLNLDTIKGIVGVIKSVIFMTLILEGIGAFLSFFVFVKDYSPIQALGISLFHSIATYNNAGFDILGGFQSLTYYQNNPLLVISTGSLIILGSMGFVVIKEIIRKKKFKKFSLHSKIVLTMTGVLLIGGTILLKITEDISWLGAFFQSTTTRTAGFSVYSLDTFSNAGLFIMIILMFIGASPGSTGGGVKTTTIFTLVKSAYSISTNKHCMAFKRKIPNDLVVKAFMISLLAVGLICFDAILICMIEPQFSFMEVFFEVVSAFSTAGLSMGITPNLSVVSKLILIPTMFIGRLGPLTMATIWTYKPKSSVSYSEENIMIG